MYQQFLKRFSDVSWENTFQVLLDPNGFDFDEKAQPFNDIALPAIAVIAYLFLIFLVLPNVTLFQKRLKPVLAMHNIILCVASIAMFVGTLHALYETKSFGIDRFFCEDPKAKASGSLYYWSYIYYLSKYYELFDTCLAILNGSRIPHFKLHVFHHACVLFMAFNWLRARQSLQFGGLLFNTFVHIVMYYYYTLKASGVKEIWWKKWITTLQIVQFTCSAVLLCITISYIWREGMSGCAGTTEMLMNFAFNMILLNGFVGVLTTKKKKGKDDNKKTK